ncbi:TPA: MBL fold metallo-hydrolase [bacterium]|nr:MBL fold metallo-hydrolase [bacterium]
MSKESLSNITEVASGVYFRFGDVGRGQANGGYIVCDDYVIAVEAPSVESTPEMFAEIKKITDKPIKFVIITHGHWDHELGIDGFTKEGVTIICHEEARKKYAKEGKSGMFIGVTDRIGINNGKKTIELFTCGTNHSATDLFTYLPDEGIIYTGDSVVSMPSTIWMGECDIWNWIKTLHKFSKMNLKYICTGHGPVGGKEVLAKLSKHLTLLRDEIGYQVSQGRSFEKTLECINIPTRADFTPDDNQFKDHVKSIYDQLTSDPPSVKNGIIPHALILIGDHYHPPFYIPPSLEPVFEKIGMPIYFTYDVTKLNKENLKGVRLLVILRDGMIWSQNDKDMEFWMTEEQEKAIADFVANGGGFLSLHNSTALKCLDEKQTTYRDVLGSSYNGHGPGDEKFDVKVVNKEHPITAGVNDYVAVDERHTPIIHADDITLLTEAVNGDQKSVNGYTRFYGKGRICHLANGHNLEVLTNPEMQKLMYNGALWCLGLL